MKKLLLVLTVGLFLGAGTANACDGHKAKASKADKASVTAPASSEAKKECSTADKKACADHAKADKSCCSSAKGAKVENKTEVKENQKKS
jgi:hypothetical protein